MEKKQYQPCKPLTTHRARTKRVVTQYLIGIFLAVTTSSAVAMPTYARQFKNQYGYAPSCGACHREGGGTVLNGYGLAFKDNGQNGTAFALIATMDSDGDGTANDDEALAKSNPGDKESTPDRKGDWLDLSSVIPKEVQALFPTATAWMPLDTNFTPKDIEAAENMGATLGVEDENTIYIPVVDRRPIGAALIFPVSYQDETFFLLMSTDRVLNISEIEVLHGEDIPAASASEHYEGLIGKPAQSVSVSNGTELDSSITKAVKKAGILLYIRLRGS